MAEIYEREIAELEGERDAWRAARVTLTAVERRSTSGSLLLLPFLRLTRELEEDAVALGAADLSGGGATVDMSLRGVTMGAAARGRLADSLGALGLESDEVGWRKLGRCWEFHLEATVPPSEHPEDDAYYGAGLLDGDISSTCGEPKAPLPGEATAPSDWEDEVPSTGTVIFLRSVALIDVYQVLHRVLGLNYVVSSALEGEVTMQIDEQTAPEEFARAGIVIGMDYLTAVSVRGEIAPVEVPDGGWSELVGDIDLRRVGSADLLCLLQGALGVDLRVAASDLPGISVFASVAPLDQVLTSVAALAGLEVERNGERWLVRTSGSDAAVLDPCDAESDYLVRDWTEAATDLQNLSTEDLVLAGLARVEGNWTGYAYGPATGPYGPARGLLVLEVGALLHDGEVVAVSEHGVEVRAESGGSLSLDW